MWSPILGLAAVVLGIVCILADHGIGRLSPRGPESGATLSRVLGLILIVGGGLAFLGWSGAV